MDEVQKYLDIREINGYSIQYTEFRPIDPTLKAIRCLVYIGHPENPQFVGPQEPQDLAAHIAKSKGPSGGNEEYLFMLEQALQELSEGSGDGHVQDLAKRVRQIKEADSKQCANIYVADSQVARKAVASEIDRIKSGKNQDPQEEGDKS